MTCAQCNAGNIDGNKFCNLCGAPFGIVCDRCKVLNDANAHFCGACGFPFIQALRQEADGLASGLLRFTSAASQYNLQDIEDLLDLRSKIQKEEDSSRSLPQDDINKIFE